MRLTAAQVGYFEDYEGEEALEVAIAGVDDAGNQRSFSFQRSSLGEPEEQDVENEMDSYNISNEQGATAYGGLRTVQLDGLRLSLEFLPLDAEELEIESPLEIDLAGVGIDLDYFSSRLRNILEWGAVEKRPAIIGLGLPEAPAAE